MNVRNCIDDIKYLLDDIKELMAQYGHIWHNRNKESDYKYSLKRLQILECKYNNLLNLLKI